MERLEGGAGASSQPTVGLPYTVAMELTLKPEVEALIQNALNSGRFENPNDVLETALHALSDQEALLGTDLGAKIQQGLEEIDRGDVFTK